MKKRNTLTAIAMVIALHSVYAYSPQSVNLFTIEIWQKLTTVVKDQIRWQAEACDGLSLTQVAWFVNDPCQGANLGGIVWQDYDLDGVKDAAETVGIPNVTVQVFNCSGVLVANDVTDNYGNWYINPTNITFPVRVEFAGLPAWSNATLKGTGSKTSVQVVASASCNVNFGISSPDDYCNTTDPATAVICYESGNAVYSSNGNTNKGIVSMPYNSSGLTPMGISEVAQIYQVGTVWGMAWQAKNKRLFAANTLKRHSGMADKGMGGVYVMDYSTGVSVFSTSFDLQGVAPANGGANIDLGSVTRSGSSDYTLPNSNDTDSWDLDAFGKIGKVGFGDADISPDGNTLWLVNLNQPGLITVDVSSTTYPGTVKQYLLSNATGVPSCTNGILRPWGLGFNKGKGYLGCVCTAENGGSASNLQAYVLSFNPANPTAFTTEINFPLNYTREKAVEFPSFNLDIAGEWKPWISTWAATGYSNNPPSETGYPQPILSDIDFTDDGAMVLGFADRFGFQMGYKNYIPVSGDNSLTSGDVAGDIIKVCRVDGTWVLEGGSGCSENDSGSTSALVTDGPSGTGEFFYGDYFDDTNRLPTYNHNETFMGGLSVLKGSNEVAAGHYDPINGPGYAFDLGLVWHNITTGARTDQFRVVDSGPAETKGNGFGDMAFICAAAPMQIGNIVWNDANLNGSQDPCEAGLNGVNVKLYKMGGGTSTLIATTTTTTINGQAGSWFFSDYQELGTGYDTLTPNTMYFVTMGEGGQFNTADGTLTLGADRYQLTIVNTGLGANTDLNDADASIVNDVTKPFNGYPAIAITLGNEGYVNHSLDFGLFLVQPPFIGNDLETCNQVEQQFIAFTNSGSMNDSIPGEWQVHTAAGSSAFFTTVPGDSLLSVIFLNITGDPKVDTVIFTNEIGLSDTALVTVYPNEDTTIYAEICSGQTYPFNGENLSFSGTYYETWTSVHGCDSLVVLELTVLSAPFEFLLYEGCQGDGHSMEVNGTIYNESNPIGEEILTASNGCDSTVSIGMVFFPSINEVLSYDGCQGDGYSVTVNGTVYDESHPMGIETMSNAYGCDSTLNVNLVFHAPSSSQVSHNGCSGDGFSVVVNGTTYDESNPIGVESMTNSLGCDSTVSINLDFHQIGLTASITNASGPGTNDGSIDLSVASNDAPFTYDWDIDGAEVPDNDPQDANNLLAGTYTVTVTAAGGCTATSSFMVAGPNCNLTLTSVPTPVACFGGATGAINLTVSDGAEPYGYDWSNDGPESFNNDPQDLMALPSGNYTVTVEDSQGCTATLTTNVSQPNALNLTGIPYNTTAVGANDGSVDITVSGGTQPYAFDWSNDGPENPDNDGEDIFDLVAGTYSVTITDANGCTKTGNYTVSDPLVFDLAVRKTLATGQPSVVSPGEYVNFTITVFNQGQIAATNVLVLDYVPTNMTFEASGNSGWSNFGIGPTWFIPSLPIGQSLTKNIKLKVKTDAPNGTLNNYVEISSANDADPNTSELPTDIDSDPDALASNDPGGLPGSPADNIITGNGMGAPGSNDPLTDEDDHDGAAVDVNTPSVSVGNLVFHDANNDGDYDAGEQGLVGIEVELYDAGLDHIKGTNDDEFVAMQATNNAGEFLFDGLPEGFYYILLNGIGIPSGYVSSTGGGIYDNDANGTVEPATGTNLNVDNVDDGTQMGVSIMSEVLELSLGDEPSGNSNFTVDFGLYQPQALPTLSVGNLVFFDYDNDGLFNNNDAGIEDVEVELYDAGPDQTKGTSDDEFIGSQATNGFGEYLFTGLPAGHYYVWLNGGGIPANHVSSTGDGIYDSDASGSFEPAMGTNNNQDNSDDGTQMGVGIMSEVIELSLGDEPNGNDNYTVDFGLYEPQASPTLSLGNLVFYDYDNDGVFNNNDSGIEDVEVELYDAGQDGIKGTSDDAFIDSHLTNGFGEYLFTGLGEGFYFLKLSGNGIAANLISSTGDGIYDNDGAGGAEPALGTNDNVDNTDDGTQMGAMVMSEVLELTLGGEPDGDVNTTVDFGLYEPQPLPTLSLGNLVFYDYNNDGLFNNNDSGIEDVEVDLYDAGPDEIKGTPDDEYLATETTNGFGEYLFTGLAEGFYYVKLNGNGIPANHVSSTGDGVYDVNATGAYEPATGTNNNLDNSDDGSQMGSMVMSEVLELTLGGEPDGDVNTTVDFGLYLPQQLPAFLGNFVWYDNDHDGQQDPFEPGVEGVEVNLMSTGADGVKGGGDDSLVETQYTPANGGYFFQNIIPGKYYVQFDLGSLPAHYHPTAQNQGPDLTDSDVDAMGMTSVVTLAPTEENLTIDFGIEPELASLGDFVWYDYNNDGLQTPNEPGVWQVMVGLYDLGNDGVKGGGDDNLLSTNVTNGDGFYGFTDLEPGMYYLSFSLFSLPVGYTPVLQNAGNNDAEDCDANAMGMTDVIILAAGENNPNIDLGIYSNDFDLSLTKNLSAGQPTTVDIGDEVAYTISVTNQGNNPAFNITITDNIPTGLIFSPNNQGWTLTAPQIAEYTIPGPLYPGQSEYVEILLTVQYGTNGQTLQNTAEVTSVTDGNGNSVTDVDSTPDNSNPDEDDTDDAEIELIPHDPTGWIYCDKTGKVITGGTISVTGPNGIPNSQVIIVHNGVDGYYEFYTDGTPGTYTISYNHPLGYPLSVNCAAQPGPFDPTGMPDPIVFGVDTLNAMYISSYSCASNPYYLSFAIQPGDPNIHLNNLPVSCTYIGSLVCDDTNHNDVADAGDLPLAGETVYLYTCANLMVPIASTTTDASGRYRFDGMVPGNYVVGYDPGANIRFVSMGEINQTGFSDCITLAWGECDTTKTICLYACPTINAGPDIDHCSSASSSQLDANLTHGTGNFTWSPTSGLSNANIEAPIASPLSSTTYIVNFNDGFGCVDSDTIRVNVGSSTPFLTNMPFTDQTVQCTAITDTPTFADVCDASLTIVADTTITNLPCGFVREITWTATNDEGNSAIFTQTLTVEDTQAPTLSASHIFFGPILDGDTLYADCSMIPALDSMGFASSDNCGVPTVNFSENVTQGNCLVDGFYQLRHCGWTSTDACGNVDSLFFVVVITDNQAPTLAPAPANATVSCSAIPAPPSLAATDNCDTTPTVIVDDVEVFDVNGCLLQITRTWLATDDCGNSTNAVQVITVVDNTSPTLVGVPANMNLSCNAPLPAIPVVTATDNCDNDVPVTYGETTNGNPATGCYSITRTWTATDNCGNTSSSSQVVTISDNTPPTLSGVPADMSISCATPIPAAPAVTASDFCDGSVVPTMVQSYIGNPTTGCFTLVRTWTATDDCGNMATASQNIQVFDNQGPVLVGVPTDATYACGTPIPAAPSVSAIDNCGVIGTVNYNQNIVGNLASGCYVLTRTWSATDNCGNLTTNSQVITVQDNQPPVLSAMPADSSLSCLSQVPVAPTVTATDNCDSNVPVLYSVTTLGNPLGCNFQILRTWAAADDCANAVAHTQTITVNDNTPPVLAAVPANLVISCSTPLPAVPTITATDNCDASVTVTMTPTYFGDPASGCYILTRTWTATDDCGNTATAAQTITVYDTEAPNFVGLPVGGNVNCDNIPGSNLTATDNCDATVTVNFSDQIQSSVNGCVTQIIRTWTASDDCGNTRIASRTFNLSNTDAPDLTIVEPAMAGVQHGDVLHLECQDLVSLSAASATAAPDCCGAPDIEFFEYITPTNCQANGYVATMVCGWVATDCCGNVDSLFFTVFVEDNTPPELVNVPANAILPVGSSLPNPPIVVALDNCDHLVPISYNSVTTGPADNQLTTRTWSASDDCGNVAVAVQTILITNDNQAPLIANVPPDITIEGPIGSLPGDDQGVTVTDNLDDDPSIVFTSEKVGGLCCYIVTNTWVATDDFGNTSIATQTITVTDTQAPVIIGSASDVTATCSLGNVPMPVFSATDNCAGQVALHFTADTTYLNCGFHVLRKWEFSDECGNISTATQTITLEDNEGPSFDHGAEPSVAFFASQNANSNGGISLSVGDEISPAQPWSIGNQSMPTFDDLSSDNCTNNQDIRYRLANVVVEDHPCQQDWLVYFDVLDGCGNQNANPFIVIASFVDDVKPSFANLPQDIAIDCEMPLPAVSMTATDNASGLVNIEYAEVMGGGCPATITRTWTAKDACGNSNIAQQIVSLMDDDAPVIENVPASVAANCGDVPPVPVNVLASDNCATNLPVNFTESINGTDCSYTITRTWTTSDACGNAAIKKQYIWVADHEAPVITTTIDPEIIVHCNEPVPPAANLSFSDNCDDSPAVDFVETVSQQGDCSQTIHRVWAVSDECGNTVIAEQNILIKDEEKPVFMSVPSNLTVGCDNVPTAAALTATDNCDNDVAIGFQETTVSASGTGCPYFIVRTWKAVDNCGNEEQASQVITVVDTELPNLTAPPADLQVDCPSAVPAAVFLSASDNCGQNLPVTLQETVTGTGCNQSVLRKWTATDACGNTAIATQTILVEDTKPPVFTSVPSNLTLLCSEQLPAPLTLVANDNCDQQVQIDYVQTVVPTNCGQKLLRTWTATDDCGNVSAVSQEINLEDNLAPTVIEPDDVLVNCGVFPPAATPAFADNCDGNLSIQFSEITTAVNCGQNIQRTWTATDDCGNSTSIDQIIEQRDLTAPSLVFNHPALTGLANNDTLVLGCDNNLIFEKTDVLATDNCSSLAIQFNMEDFHFGNCNTDGYVVAAKFKWTATDDCGNTTDLVLNVKTVDNEAPIFEDIPDVVVVNCGQPAPDFIAPNVADGCSDATLGFASQTLPTTYGQDIVGTWTANDNCGNISTLTQTMQVYSIGAGQLIGVPNDTTINLGLGETVPPAASVLGVDNCSGAALLVDYQETTTQNGPCTSLVERSWSVVGLNGVTVTETQTITLVNGVQFAAAMTPDSCNAGNGILAMSPANLTYQWSDGGTGAMRSDLVAGIYQVTATNADGCSSTSTVEVEAACNCQAALVEKINHNETPCGENKGKATIFLYQDEADYVYEWLPNLGNSNALGNAHNQLPAGHYQVFIKYNNVLNCVTSVEFDIYDDCPDCATQEGNVAVSATVGPTVVNEVCLPIPYGMLSAYEVKVNGQLYAGLLEPCDPHDVKIYDYSGLPSSGPYSVAWQHDGTTFYTLVNNMFELAAAMGYVDPEGLWYNDAANTELVSQKADGDYGQLTIRKHSTGAVLNLQALVTTSNVGAMVSIQGGNQVVTYANLATGCAGSIQVNFTDEDTEAAEVALQQLPGDLGREASEAQALAESGIVVYNAFSPNGDGINDYFKIEGLDNYPKHKLQIFSSLGHIVFKTVAYQNDWGGSWGQNNLPDGTYYYLLEDGKGASFTGFVQIRR